MSSKVIAIDGPAYVGKSEIAKALSRLTGFAYVNTGHMYRAVARKAIDLHYSYDHHESICKLAKKTKIEFINNNTWRTYVDGQDWTDLLNDYSIVSFAAKIATNPGLREHLTKKQRELARKQTIIMEGRDIGSIVFPDASWKFFVTATEEIRAKRLWKTLTEEEQKMNPESEMFISKIQHIDDLDKNRKIAPLIEPVDAITYDNSGDQDAAADARRLKQCMDHPEIIPASKKIFYKEFEAVYGKHR